MRWWNGRHDQHLWHLVRQYLQSIPDEWLDAERMDDCGEFGVEGMTAGVVKG